jgi:hypothetical protein
MKKLIDYLLINEMVLIKDDHIKDASDQIGRIVSVRPGEDKVTVEFSHDHYGTYSKEQLLHLYPTTVIMQKLLSNFDIGKKNFGALMMVYKLMSVKRIRDALKLIAENSIVKSICTVDCVKWLELQLSYKQGNNRKLRH